MAKRVSAALIIFFIFSSGRLFAQGDALRKAERLILQEDYSQAARQCQKVLAASRPAAVKSKAYYLLGLSLLKQSKYEQARVQFNQVLRRYQQSEFYDDASLGIANSYFLAGDFKQAEIKYKKFLRNFPRSQLRSIAVAQQKMCREKKHFADSYFSVQVGCFGKKANADKLRDKLINSGFQAYILQLPGENRHRVRVGRFDTRLKAEFLEQPA